MRDPNEIDPRVWPLIGADGGAASRESAVRVAKNLLREMDIEDQARGIYRVCLTDAELTRGLAITIAKATGFSHGRAETLADALVGEIVGSAEVWV